MYGLKVEITSKGFSGNSTHRIWTPHPVTSIKLDELELIGLDYLVTENAKLVELLDSISDECYGSCCLPQSVVDWKIAKVEAKSLAEKEVQIAALGKAQFRSKELHLQIRNLELEAQAIQQTINKMYEELK